MSIWKELQKLIETDPERELSLRRNLIIKMNNKSIKKQLGERAEYEFAPCMNRLRVYKSPV